MASILGSLFIIPLAIQIRKRKTARKQSTLYTPTSVASTVPPPEPPSIAPEVEATLPAEMKGNPFAHRIRRPRRANSHRAPQPQRQPSGSSRAPQVSPSPAGLAALPEHEPVAAWHSTQPSGQAYNENLSPASAPPRPSAPVAEHLPDEGDDDSEMPDNYSVVSSVTYASSRRGSHTVV